MRHMRSSGMIVYGMFTTKTAGRLASARFAASVSASVSAPVSAGCTPLAQVLLRACARRWQMAGGLAVSPLVT